LHLQKDGAVSRTHCNLLYQITLSTKAHVRFLTPDLRPKTHRYFANSVQGVDGIPLSINATEDHVQLLVKLSQNHALSNVLSEVKSNSSGWIHRQDRGLAHFACRAYYGAFAVRTSQKERVYLYIKNQEAGPGEYPFRAEYMGVLKAHEVEFDEHYIWD